MRDDIPDVLRLEILLSQIMGMEAFSLSARLQDAIRYFFSHMVHNVKTYHEDFSESELFRLNIRHKTKLAQFIKSPHPLKSTLVSIPKGMTGSYLSTLDALVSVLETIDARSLEGDMVVLDQKISDRIPEGSIPLFSKAQFDKVSRRLGDLFVKHGFIQAHFDKAIGPWSNLDRVNQQIMALTRVEYPNTIRLQRTSHALEKEHHALQAPSEVHAEITQMILSVAYRLTLYAKVVDYLQEIEHAFCVWLEKNIR